MANFWQFFAYSIFSEPRAARLSQTCILNLHYGHVQKYGRHPICDGWD